MASLRTALGVVAALLCAAVTACSSDGDAQRKPCPTEPAFQLTLRAAQGPLPEDTVLKVVYGGGVEEFKLSDPVHTEEVVLCDIETDDAGAGTDAGGDGGAPRVLSLSCKVWAQGAATVTATGTGYPDVQRQLEAELDGKCIKTVPVDLLLGELDAGI